MLTISAGSRGIRGLRVSCCFRRAMRQEYVTQKQIDQVIKQHPEDTYLAKAKIAMGVVKLLCTKGFKDSKADFKLFREIGRKSPQERTEDEIQKYRRIKSDLIKAVPAFLVLFAPAGGPLFFLYLKLFPNFTPTWILTESIYKRLQKLQLDNHIRAIIYFKNVYSEADPSLLASTIAKEYREGQNVQNPNEHLRMISRLLMGYYQDGTYYLDYHSPLKRLNWRYFLTHSWSQWLMRWSIDRHVRNSLIQEGRQADQSGCNLKFQELLAKSIRDHPHSLKINE